MDFFLVKKMLSLFLHLVPGCIVLILLAILLRNTRLRRLSTPIALLGVVILLLASTPTISNKAIYSLEDQFQLMSAPPADTTLFLTLGNFASDAVGHPPNAQLHATSLSRVTETIRLWKQQPAAKLFMGGPSRFAMRDFAVENGVAMDQIIIDHKVRDTIDEISAALKFSSHIAVSGRTVIVSSATHLPRAKLIVDEAVALKLVQRATIPHSYAPSDFIAAPSERPIHASSSYLHKTDRVLHEYVGMIWIKLRIFLTTVLSE